MPWNVITLNRHFSFQVDFNVCQQNTFREELKCSVLLRENSSQSTYSQIAEPL